MNQELPDIQAGLRKGRETRDQTGNIHGIIEKAREFQKNICFCFIVIHTVKGLGIVNKTEVDIFSYSLAFSMIPWMLTI